MTTSNTITKADLTNILNELLPIVQHTARVGEINMFAGSTAPMGWLICNGSAVSRTTYSALFAVIGTTYGTGDGSTTFNLPDFRNNFPVGAGSTYSLNSKGGSNTVTLNVNQIPSHNHTIGVAWTTSGSGNHSVDWHGTYRNDTNASVVDHTGGGQAHENRPPYIGINFIIYAGTDYPTILDRAIPNGGTTGQVLAKSSNDDFDLSWSTPKGETRTLLWTNPSPNNSFAAQDVTSGMSGAYNTYDFIEVEYKAINTEDSDYGAKIIERTTCHSGTVASIVSYNNAWYLRHRARWWNSNATGIHFDSGFYNNLVTPSTNGQNDAILIPYHIWGIKTLG